MRQARTAARSATNIGNLAHNKPSTYCRDVAFQFKPTGKMSALLETPSRIEPCFLEGDIPRPIADLVVDIHAASADLGKSVHPDAAAELAEFVRVMNCYYSNLVEGHDTRPRDIELALDGAELEDNTRPLALEARAHVKVHREIDALHREGKLPSPTSV